MGPSVKKFENHCKEGFFKRVMKTGKWFCLDPSVFCHKRRTILLLPKRDASDYLNQTADFSFPSVRFWQDESKRIPLSVTLKEKRTRALLLFPRLIRNLFFLAGGIFAATIQRRDVGTGRQSVFLFRSLAVCLPVY